MKPGIRPKPTCRPLTEAGISVPQPWTSRQGAPMHQLPLSSLHRDLNLRNNHNLQHLLQLSLRVIISSSKCASHQLHRRSIKSSHNSSKQSHRAANRKTGAKTSMQNRKTAAEDATYLQPADTAETVSPTDTAAAGSTGESRLCRAQKS